MLLQKEIRQMREQQEPIQQSLKAAEQIRGFETLNLEVEEYLEWRTQMELLAEKYQEKERIKQRLASADHQDIHQLEMERDEIVEQMEKEEKAIRQLAGKQMKAENVMADLRERSLELEELLAEKQREFSANPVYEERFAAHIRGKENVLYESLQNKYRNILAENENEIEKERDILIGLRSDYLCNYPNRNFSPTEESNRDYSQLYDRLNSDSLEEFRKRAADQARTAVMHFKDDFMYKIRSAIKEAHQKKDELNRIISNLDFGKDKYQFYIGKNKGPDGKYYDMFMDDSLDINPSKLDIGIDNQLNLFTMEHESHYGAMINDLIGIFIPPENATAEELEAAKRNMDKYADYRTYLTFDMQQLVQNEEETIKIHLSRMITKNSGGEGQNPLYVALLASFAQAYRIDRNPHIRQNPTIRLVVLDEAFSKMDAEKVSSCIKLMRGLGFQAIISATNDKIQNYLETVDKVFVFANPNKKAISIQEFERCEFEILKEEVS